MEDSDLLKRFLDNDGRLRQWPAKQRFQTLALAYLAAKFELDRTYTEPEVNDTLNRWHTYGDWATLRRALVDARLLIRKRDGSEYRRVTQS